MEHGRQQFNIFEYIQNENVSNYRDQSNVVWRLYKFIELYVKLFL